MPTPSVTRKATVALCNESIFVATTVTGSNVPTSNGGTTVSALSDCSTKIVWMPSLSWICQVPVVAVKTPPQLSVHASLQGWSASQGAQVSPLLPQAPVLLPGSQIKVASVQQPAQTALQLTFWPQLFGPNPHNPPHVVSGASGVHPHTRRSTPAAGHAGTAAGNAPAPGETTGAIVVDVADTRAVTAAGGTGDAVAGARSTVDRVAAIVQRDLAAAGAGLTHRLRLALGGYGWRRGRGR